LKSTKLKNLERNLHIARREGQLALLLILLRTHAVIFEKEHSSFHIDLRGMTYAGQQNIKMFTREFVNPNIQECEDGFKVEAAYFS
jgi:hypothetical protein